MRAFVVTLVALGFVAASADGADRLDELFASWEEAQRGFKSLVVEFSLDRADEVWREREKADGTFRLLRTPNGEIYASCEFTQPRLRNGKKERWSTLLNSGKLYALKHDDKVALRFDAEGDVRRFAEENVSSFVRLLDRKRAEEKFRLELLGMDDLYTYIGLKPKKVKRWGWSPDAFTEACVVLSNKDSGGVSKDMPREFWYTDDSRSCSIKIKSWRLNAPDPPKLEEFTRPEDRPGWEVGDWPFWRKK